MLHQRLPLLFLRLPWTVCRSISSRAQYAIYFQTMDLPVTSTKGQVRRRYIELAKLYHPDTQKTEQEAEKFSQIDSAYRGLQAKFKEDEAREEAMEGEYGLYYDKDRKRENDDEESDVPKINHVTPQHRQFLDNGGFGYGTPAQRQRQAQKYRAFKANEAVFERRMGQLTAQYEDRLVTTERQTVKKQQTKNQIERLVEDLIQESMASGDFDNLAGTGKPIPKRPPDFNPYMDFTTHKMNQILVETGFAPEWVELQKDIRLQTEAVRADLLQCRQSMGPAPLPQGEMIVWNSKVDKVAETVRDINKKIEKFNLIVPNMNNQKFQLNLTKEADKIFAEGYNPHLADVKSETLEVDLSHKEGIEGTFASFIKSFLNKS